MKRIARLKGIDTELEISKVTSIKSDQIMCIHFDKLSDNTWRLIYNEKLIPDFTKIECIEIIRED